MEKVATPTFRTLLRILAGLDPKDTRPIKVVTGDKGPELVGESYYWTTPSGKTIVNYPSAYGWPTEYHPSTRRVEVGREWLEERQIPLTRSLREITRLKNEEGVR